MAEPVRHDGFWRPRGADDAASAPGDTARPHPPLDPLTRESLPDALGRRIVDLIRRHRMPAGARLPAIAVMARSFGVGKASVREALRKLETLGIVTLRHGSGVYVALDGEAAPAAAGAGSATPPERADVAATRLPLELEAVARGALVASPDDLDALRRVALRRPAHKRPPAADASNDEAFHRAIARVSGNRVIARFLDMLLAMSPTPGATGVTADRAVEEHLGIVDAMERRDPPLAVERMRAHLTRPALVTHPAPRP
jgi:GntR family transcriptional regulator, transcriptional repressor for pyruvate dehydrogenase complex